MSNRRCVVCDERPAVDYCNTCTPCDNSRIVAASKLSPDEWEYGGCAAWAARRARAFERKRNRAPAARGKRR